MAKQPAAEPQYEEGKIYLRDKRNGRLHEYQELLSGMSYMERFVYSAEAMERESRNTNVAVFKSSAQERAADFDRLAAMSNKDREAELKRRDEYEAEQRRLRGEADETTVETPALEKKLVMTEKAGSVTYDAYKEQKWTDAQLVEAGLAEYK